MRAVLATLLSTRTAPLPTDIALIAVRTALAVDLHLPRRPETLRVVRRPGLDRSADVLREHRRTCTRESSSPSSSGVIEFGGGIAIAFGFVSRLAGAAIFVDMMMAIITVTWSNGINAADPEGGYELNLALGVLALVVAIFGAGRFSVDALLERRLLAAEARAPA